MESFKYDQLLLSSIENQKFIKENTVYYNDYYLRELVISMLDNNCLSNYVGELSTNSQGIKMCSIGSSSRLCYLASFVKYTGIKEHEKTDIKNGCCRPHYDGYDPAANIFYEFKCHELCDGCSHYKLTDSYIPLLMEYFDISKNPKDLIFSDFGDFREEYNDKSIYKINFDFKQFLCHVFGLFKVASLNKLTTLKYVWVTPRLSLSEELQNFVNKIEAEIKHVFKCFSVKEINFNGKKITISKIIDFKLEVIEISDVEDFILKGLLQ